MALAEHLLQVTFPARAQVSRGSRSDGANLEIFFPIRQNVPLGRQVRVLVAFGDAPDTFQLLGRVCFLRAASKAGVEQGLGVEFSGIERTQAEAMLAFCADAPLLDQVDEDGSPSSKRVRITKLRCRVTVAGQTYPGEVVDLSSTGVFVNAPTVPRLKIGSKVDLQFKGGLLSWGPVLELRVVWHGEKRGQPGFGGRFVGDSSRVASEVTKHLAAARSPRLPE